MLTFIFILGSLYQPRMAEYGEMEKDEVLGGKPAPVSLRS